MGGRGRQLHVGNNQRYMGLRVAAFKVVSISWQRTHRKIADTKEADMSSSVSCLNDLSRCDLLCFCIMFQLHSAVQVSSGHPTGIPDVLVQIKSTCYGVCVTHHRSVIVTSRL